MTQSLYEPRLDRGNGAVRARMAREVRQGLLAPQRYLPSKYFYDDRGSMLFEEITRLPEYYQARTEEKLLESVARDVVRRVAPRELVELGSGAGRKVRVLLDEMRRDARRCSLTLLDINRSFVELAASRIGGDYPDVSVRGVVADFTEDLSMLGPGGFRLVVFLAGTIGNLEPAQVPAFLARVAAQLEPGDGLLVGLDLVKGRARLEAAYNDSAGVTAAFNLNILRHLNAALGADFDLGAFEHVAFWDGDAGWIEMRLRATRASVARVPAARLEVAFRPGDEIRTEISCKYTRASFQRLLPGTGLAMEAWYRDRGNQFALALLTRSGMAGFSA
jgi:L-histidine N-alpha-methyltransferase